MHCLHSVFVRIRERELREKKKRERGGGGSLLYGTRFSRKMREDREFIIIIIMPLPSRDRDSE